MVITLPVPVIIILDIVGWFLIHMGMAYLFTRLPAEYIDPENPLFRSRKWEQSGAFYDRVFGVRRWKGYLPDGAALFAGGFRKKHLADTGVMYYRRFIIETCRGEAAHWAVILCTPVFFLFNYRWANIVMVVYALTANIPCILTQRYNRLRLRKLLDKRLIRADTM